MSSPGCLSTYVGGSSWTHDTGSNSTTNSAHSARRGTRSSYLRPPDYDADTLPGRRLSPSRWPDNSADFGPLYNDAYNPRAYIDDRYEPADRPVGLIAIFNIVRKLNAVTVHLTKAATDFRGGLFTTFASGEHNDNDPYFPEVVALRNGTDDTLLGGAAWEI